MMYCTKCGKEIPDGQKICDQCAEKYGINSQPPENAQAIDDGKLPSSPDGTASGNAGEPKETASAENNPQTPEKAPEEEYDIPDSEPESSADYVTPAQGEDGKGENAPKYFRHTDLTIIVIAIIIVLASSAATLFAVKLLQGNSNQQPAIDVTAYSPETTAPSTQEPTVKNTLKDPTVEDLYGSWKFETDREEDGKAIPYYTFFENGNVQENYGSMLVKGTFLDVSKSNEDMIFVDIDSTLDGIFYFDIKGNKDDGYTLKLTNSVNGILYVLKSTTAKSYTLDSIPKFKTDKKILGNWINEDGTKTYTFNKNGSLSRTVGSVTTTGVWSIDDKHTITIKYMREAVNTTTVNYAFNKNKLIVNNVIYTKDKSK